MSLVLGPEVGLISLLVVKSGSGILLMSNLRIEMPFNPYSTALARVVSGRFSGELFQFLSTLIDRATKKESDKQPTKPPRSDPTPQPYSRQKDPDGN